MPRYFFDTEDGAQDTDDRGTELAGEDAAIAEAVRYAGMLVSDQPSMLTGNNELSVTVRCAENGPFARVRVELSRLTPV
jgi:hypothetical protein